MRALILSFSVVLTLLTNAAAGVALGTKPAADTVVICRGHATIVIHLDEDGNEVAGWQLCPETIGHLMMAVADGAPQASVPMRLGDSVTSAPQTAQATQPYIYDQRSRAPPLTL